MNQATLSAFVDRLAAETGNEFAMDNGMVVLQDEDGRDRLAIEEGSQDGAVHLIAPVRPFPTEAIASPINLFLLQLNADTDFLGDARIAADPNRRTYLLVRKVTLLEDDERVVDICDGVLEQAEQIAAALAEIEDSATPGAHDDDGPTLRV